MARPKTIHNRTELIIEAGDELFARYGYERTSMDDIASHLNIGKGSIYLEFRTKEEILLAILNNYSQRLCKAMQEQADHATGSPLAILQKMMEESVMTVFDRATRDFHTPAALLHTSIQMKNHFPDFFAAKRALILKILTRAAQAGEIPKNKASEEVAFAFMMGTSSLYPPYINNYSESQSRFSRSELSDRAPILIGMLISGLRKPNKKGSETERN